MTNKQQQIPAIRFNGFTDAWEQRKLSDIVKLFGGYAFSSADSNSYGIPWLKIANVGKNGIDWSSASYLPDNFWLDYEDFRLFTGDYVMALTRPIISHALKIAVVDKNALLNQRVAKLIFDTNEEYGFQLLQRRTVVDRIESELAGTDPPNLGSGNLKNITISITSNNNEQSKIGIFFKKLDDTIALHQRQLDNYKELQKSLLQKIFNQELRFKDKYGDDYPEWEKEKLGNLITEVVEKSTIQDQYPILSSTNKGLFLQSEYFKSNIASDDNIGYKVLRQNEIVFSPQNLWMGNINFNDKYEAGIVSPSYKIFSVNDGIVHEFMKFMIKTQYMMNEYVLSSEQGASIVRRNLDMELFNKIKVKIPTIPEQKKITDFLIASDDQIDQVAQKLERLKEQKKGLMQRMFV